MLSSITQDRGDIEISQLVKLYSASIVLSGDIPGGILIAISTCSAVLSSTFLILIFPLSFALRIDWIKEATWWRRGRIRKR